ncbi:hypothetical protein SETIT_1G205900v2 [Setaria italica]|uniref:Uncharacterized protein n=1 Tax=Setaria italica TaxID=4555 RepID=K3YZR8_SETIT|nr:uncharacterized protein LOC101758707 [Setaria italica]RCV06962.1 hypothetical protein SETIT_1G205900v2 [Setaria italica]
MASMMGGDFVEAYVLRNACKEKLRRMKAAEERKRKGGSGEKKDATSSGGSGSGSGSGSGRGGGLFGLVKKKVHPKAAASSETTVGASA